MDKEDFEIFKILISRSDFYINQNNGDTLNQFVSLKKKWLHIFHNKIDVDDACSLGKFDKTT